MTKRTPRPIAPRGPAVQPPAPSFPDSAERRAERTGPRPGSCWGLPGCGVDVRNHRFQTPPSPSPVPARTFADRTSSVWKSGPFLTFKVAAALLPQVDPVCHPLSVSMSFWVAALSFQLPTELKGSTYVWE